MICLGTLSFYILIPFSSSIKINFFKDHTKLIICPRMAAVTYIDEKKNFRTFPLKNIERYGCCKEIVCRLQYARTMVDRLKLKAAGQGGTNTADAEFTRTPCDRNHCH